MHRFICLVAMSAASVTTSAAFAVIVASDNPSGPSTVTTYNGGASGFSIVETVSYDGAAGAWQKELINTDAPPPQLFSGQLVPIVEQLTNAGPSAWTDWHEEILPNPSDPPFPDFLFRAGSLQVTRNNVALIQGVDYTLVPTINNTGIGVTSGGDWLALSIFFSPSAVIQPGDILGIRKDIFEVFGDSDVWDQGEFALIGEHPSVPEPSTLALAAFGLIGLAAWGWRRRTR
jgi:PEP-CTERM motif